MKKGKIGIALFSAAVLLVILLMAIHMQPGAVKVQPVVLQVTNETGTDELNVWTAENGGLYAFLPGHVQPDQVVILPADGGAVKLQGQPLPLSCDHLELNRDYELVWPDGSTDTLRLLSSGGVATMYLTTQSGSMRFIHDEKGNAERGTLRLYDETGILNYSGDLKTIRGRGNSTWVVHDKKPYSLKLMDKADLLGMGAAKDWILLADALDTSAMRNKIVYDFAAEAGLSFTPECRWTEVYLNGDYAGLYLLCERVEVHPERVNLPPDGSLVCMDRDIRVEEDPTPYFTTDNRQYLQIRESSDLGTLKKQFQSMENAILAVDGRDAATGASWEELIDVESWVKKYLIEEIFDSYDANFQSQYYYCYETNEGTPVYAGPVWDYDSSLGNPLIWALNSPRGLFAWRPEAMTGYATPWLHSLYEKPVFRAKLEEEYREVFLPLLETLLDETVDAYAQQIAPAFDRNQIRWNVDSDGVGAEAKAITDYMEQRIEFLSQLWLEHKEFCIVRLREGDVGGYYGYYAVEPGTVFADLPEKEGEDFLGWYREDTETVFDPEQPVTEDLFLYPKYAHSAENEESHEDGLMDLILEVYHYVPAGVLALMGLGLVPFSVRRSRTGKKQEPSRTR